MTMTIPVFDYLWQYVDHWGAVDADFPAVRHAQTMIRAGELAAQVEGLARALRAVGVRKGDTVLTILPSIPAYVITLCAAGKIGAITVPMDVRYRDADYARLLPRIAPKAVISLPRVDDYDLATLLDRELTDVPRWFVDSAAFAAALHSEQQHDAGETITPDDPALIIFTGGTTGLPKAALLTHRNITATIRCELDYLSAQLAAQGVQGRIKSLAALPPSHIGGTLEVIGTAVMGGWELIMHTSWSPTEVLQTTQDEGIAWIGGVPTMFAILLSLPNLADYELSGVRLAVMSGEKVSLELLRGVRERICHTILNGYGSTEAGAEVTFTAPDDPLERLAEGYVGKPLGDQQVRIVDDADQLLPHGEVGEILVRGAMTIRSYYNMPDEDTAGFTADGWCRTGDLGSLSLEGGLTIRGRKKQIIRVGSYTVLPTEIEELVIQQPGVALAAAVGMPNAIYGEVIWLAVVPEDGQALDQEALLNICRAQLANYKVPRQVVITTELPMTRIGKVDRVALRDQLMAQHG